jgi:RHS repeat-associated protein
MGPKLFLLMLLTVCLGLILQAGPLGTANAAAQLSLPASDRPAFSDPPTDAEILGCGILPQPLAPTGGTADADENQALGKALVQYEDSQRGGAPRDAVGPLTDFLESHRASRWRAALYLNLGLIYRQTGHMSKAMAAWQQAWDLSKGATEANARAVADYAVGQLANFEAYLGRMELLAPLLAEVKGRPMHGSGAALVSDAAQGLAEMRTRPEASFRCGPMALHRICLLQGRTDKALALEHSRSTTRGTSLSQVLRLAHQIGLDYQMAYRRPGSVLIVPAVMHWKVGHFAAIARSSTRLYQVQDPTFGENILVSDATVDEEGSGYFIVPAGPLPKGWRSVPAIEGALVWGRGQGPACAHNSPNGPQGPDDCHKSSPMTSASVGLAQVSLKLDDVPLRYRTAKGPDFSFELSYTHRDTNQPAIFTFTNFGPKWTSNWIGFFTDNTNTTGTADLYAPTGGFESYTFAGGNSYQPGLDDEALVTRLMAGSKVTGFTRQLPDGSLETYAQALGSNQFLLSSVRDPRGNATVLTYDARNRITAITDSSGEKTTFTYGLASDILKVTKVTDPFGRSAAFTYNSTGELTSITDILGITSSYTYVFDSGDFISTLTTPYGTSHFSYGDSTINPHLATERFVTITNPLGQTSRVEYREAAPGIADTDPPNTVPTGMNVLNEFLTYRNTFVWDAHQYALANFGGSLDYTKASLFHWLHTPSFGAASSIPESTREPLENRVWYNYPGQTNPIEIGSIGMPSAIGRVLDDGTTQLCTFSRNQLGYVTQSMDPIGRQLTMTYAPNGIDLLSIANTTGGANQLLQTSTYNTQHEPLTVTDASGQVTKFTYNAAGQVLTITNPLKETTSYTYGPTGLLLSAKRLGTSAVNTFTYDGFNRVKTETDAQGYQLAYTYDAADRETSIGYPDGTFTQYAYKLLDLLSVTDRVKRKTLYSYDPLEELLQITDPAGQTTRFAYCDCGVPSSVTDPNGHKTNWTFDLEERLVAKTFADSSAVTNSYEKTTSRLKSQTDALSQVTAYSYNPDDTLKQVSYVNAVNPTPGVSYQYDPAFLRLIGITDGTGITTLSYYPVTATPPLGATRLMSIKGPRADVVTYGNDAMGRVVAETVDGSTSHMTFDALDRPGSESNALDSFTTTYLGVTSFPAQVASAHGLNRILGYFPNSGDERLQTITNKTHAGTVISSFQYGYNPEGDVTSSIIQKQFSTAQTRTMSYDLAGRLTGMTSTGGGSNFTYGYDPASNRALQKIGALTTNYTYNTANELTSPGPATYDRNGQPLSLGNASLKWDAAGRMISSIVGGNTTQIAYDGLNRRARITQLAGAKVVSDRFYFWCDHDLCLETDALNHNAITKRYFSQGVVQNGTPLYYSQDSLGSVSELTDALGVVQAGYSYDPFGVRTKLLGSEDSDFGFAGLFHDLPSGLDLAMYRPYSAAIGRWLNRDPIGEDGGLNLYAYASDNPFSLVDPDGTKCKKGRGRGGPRRNRIPLTLKPGQSAWIHPPNLPAGYNYWIYQGRDGNLYIYMARPIASPTSTTLNRM